jgi:hypothetical protein
MCSGAALVAEQQQAAGGNAGTDTLTVAAEDVEIEGAHNIAIHGMLQRRRSVSGSHATAVTTVRSHAKHIASQIYFAHGKVLQRSRGCL